MVYNRLRLLPLSYRLFIQFFIQFHLQDPGKISKRVHTYATRYLLVAPAKSQSGTRYESHYLYYCISSMYIPM